MPSQANPRKRSAPGTSPTLQPHPLPTSTIVASGSPLLTDDQFLNWGQSLSAAGPSFADARSTHGGHTSGGSNMAAGGSTNDANSTQLTRRPAGQNQVVARGLRPNPEHDDSWLDFGDNMQLEVRDGGVKGDDEVDLEQKAQIAKREALARRKQIPPFVQKLSSFLDQSRNTDLIRWSDRGDSFIVLDEDEFARTLIPELFKHNNYASFVRQLNMYGFHKKVGLSDNSMRASERKNKNPSEYFNRYFRRGKPDLLWLINKPKNTKTPASASAEDAPPASATDSASGGGRAAGVSAGASIGAGRSSRPMDIPRTGASGEKIVASEKDMSEVRQQLHSIQQQQRVISGAINRLRKDHNQIYEQAVAFQTLHDRHESSINAILTFLATVYNRSLNEHGAQNFANMFSNAIPPDPQARGNVVDVGDVAGQNLDQPPTRYRRQPLLLGAPSPGQDGQYGRATTVSPAPSATSPQPVQSQPTSSASSAPPTSHGFGPTQNQRRQPCQTSQRQQQQQQEQAEAEAQAANAAIEELFDPSRSANASPFLQPEGVHSPLDLDHIPASQQRDIMSMINASNASAASAASSATTPTAPTALDFPAALTHYQTANGASPLTPKQRSDMLHLIARDTHLAQPSPGTTSAAPANALTSASPPTPFLDLAQLTTRSDELDRLARMQAEQDANVENLRNMIQPLSPTGSIPGLGGQGGEQGQWYEGMGMAPGAPGQLGLDQIFDSGDYFGGGPAPAEGAGEDLVDFDAGGQPAAGGGGEFDFDAYGAGGLDASGTMLGGEMDGEDVVRTVDNSEAASPAGEDDARSPSSKRRKRG